MLRVRDVRVRFGNLDAVDGVDLEVGPGKVLALMGPSGCGKTTLLRVIAGLQNPDSGKVEWNGNDLTTVPAHQRGIGLMFQDYALFPHLDVGRNVGFGLRMTGFDRDAASDRVREALSLVGLECYERRAIAELSGGEQQRVALARTIAPEPKIVMLDEPIGSLDRTLRDRLMVEMSDLFADLGIGVLYVTHDQREAFAVADSIAVMRSGRLVQVATPEELWRAPGSAFVARFIGLDNIYSGTASAGRLDLGWTTVAGVDISAGHADVVVPPEAIAVDPRGSITATVETVAYRGGTYRVAASCGDARMHFDSPAREAAGDHVRLSIAGAQVIELAG